ncbi:putative rho gtpase activator protein [Phaeoacremonium minimum UCRPA7]|uniref:Putative rho gtpase activator protein n=1 Tax=Phaeoacremonium minimum (strain UCR-PA7) TaxID=1286976 RepID=R8BQN5_PHAM7|nr:putative rho gtpase activator protein [Phaeoacremonium minimum UCRPA7]EOO01662.1 putative rho gtpase activator protein [Phaeoacremonium minimum UCRPA7]
MTMADYNASSDYLPPTHQQRERTGSMSLGGPPPTSENGAPTNGTGPIGSPTAGPPNTQPSDVSKQVQEVLSSEIGVATMLNRLKQSIASAKEFALFLKKRSVLEDEHANGLKKLSKMTTDSMRRPDHLGGSFGVAYDDMMAIHERMAENGMQFAMSLHQMHEDLLELAAIAEKNRKGWKQNGLAAEQRVADFENAMRKSQSKYYSLAEEYDRARTGDTSGQKGKVFGFKGPKSAAQHEEDLLRKVQAADQDYQNKVQTLQAERGELVARTRPEAIKALQDIIKECDSGLVLQVQKFASFNEKLLLSNGLSISPLKAQKGQQQGQSDARSLREIVLAINSESDLNDFLSANHSKVPPRSGPVPVMPAAQRPSSRGSFQHERSFSHSSAFYDQQQQQQGLPAPQAQQQPAQQQQQFAPRNSGQIAVPNSKFNNGNMGGSMSSQQQQPQQQQGPPQLGALSFQNAPPQQQPAHQKQHSLGGGPLAQNPPSQQGSFGMAQSRGQSPPQIVPSRPVFGVSLQKLYERDGLAVPMVVYQCIQAVDLFGLTVEGIYRLSGSVPHVNRLKAMFDTDSSSPNLDFRNPENFFHDVNSVAGLLKQFFRDLPDPLLTKEHYSGFIEAARNDDDIVRRDSLHAIINALPDPNYATLRALTLHLHRVMENSASSRMNSQNLAIVFGPTLLGTSAQANIADAGWQVRVVDTILQNTYQIFDDD